jgi:ribonuclease HI
MCVNLTGSEGNVNVAIYTDSSKTEKPVGASMVAVKPCGKHIDTQRLNITCTVFQAELYGIILAVDWIQSQRKKTSYVINVDSKAALLAIANKHTTYPLAVAARMKTIKLRKSTSIAFHGSKDT